MAASLQVTSSHSHGRKTMARSRRPIRPEDIYRLREPSDPQLSPDGKWVACVVSQASREKDRWHSDIWLFSTDGKRRLQLTNRRHRDGSPRWSPDGGRIAFVAPESDGDDAKSQLWIIPLEGGEAKHITSLRQGVSSPVWSPDGKRIAFLARNPKPTDEKRDPKRPKVEVKEGRVLATDVKVIDSVRYRSSDLLPKEDRRHIYVVAAEGGKPRKITDGDGDQWLPVWSPDGKRIAFVSNRGRDLDWDLMQDVWVVPVAGGRARQLSTFAGGATSPTWSPDGKWIAYVGSPPPELFRIERQLWVQPASGGEARCLTEASEALPAAPQWSPDGTAIYFQCQEEGHVSLCRTDLQGEITRVLPKERCVTGYSIARETGAIAFTHTTPEHPADLFVCDRAGSGERRLTHLNRSVLAGIELGPTESFWCRSFDGTRIHAWVVTPPGFRPGRKYPLVLMVHGGPYSAYSHRWNLDAQVLAGQGYLVVYANPRGSTGYGWKFQTAVAGDWGRLDAKDVCAAVDHVARRGGVDKTRLGVMGASYGGFMATWLLGTTKRFAAGVASCAATDEPMFYFSADMPQWSEQELGGPPWERWEDYRRVSSSSHAHKITAPLLLLHADDDTRVPICHSEIVFTTVKRTGGNAVFVRYPSGGHGFSFSVPRYVCDSLNRTLSWFDEHLKGIKPQSKGGGKAKAKRAK
jgi:dipeptidyl aminopeptidase/acylaminoacyl peptidase